MGAGSAGFFVASAFAGSNCAARGSCTAAAAGAKRLKLATTSQTRKAAPAAITKVVIEIPAIETLVIEILYLEILAIRRAGENSDKDFFQKGNLFQLCGGGNRAASYVRAIELLVTRPEGWLGH